MSWTVLQINETCKTHQLFPGLLVDPAPHHQVNLRPLTPGVSGVLSGHIGPGEIYLMS